MYVKGLCLAGFKSFADPTLLEFEPGVNVIVGPNGSGKSNISDALAWVLGSQAPSSLRGGSMEDVIFAGSAGRPRLGIAEVELTLDNSNRALPLDLNEVTISRSTDRSGESEYRINGASCRLLDVAELLSDTGIGRSLHTVVGQGQLDAILNARPEDRRTFIEEAAQIGKYRRRKDRSVRKLERVEDNLTRLHDVLAELKRAIRPLKRQASAAAMYSELVAERRDLKQRLAATEMARLRDDDAAHDPEAETRRAHLLDEELASLRARLQTTSSQRAGLATAADEAADVAHRMARTVDRLTSLARIATERAEKMGARLAAETEEGYRERIRLLEAERERWAEESRSLRSIARRLRARAEEAAATAGAARSAREAAESSMARARTEETAAAQALVRAEGSEAAGRATVGSIEARVQAVLERREVAQHEYEDGGAAVAAAEGELRSLEGDLDAKTEEAAAAEVVLDAARERLEEVQGRLGARREDRAGAAARVEALAEVAGLLRDLPDAARRLEPLLAAARERAGVAATGEEEAGDAARAAAQDVEAAWREVARLDEQLRRLDALFSGAAERLSGARRRREKREVELATLDEELARARAALADAERAAAEERAALPARRAAVEETGGARAEADSLLRAARSAEGAAGAAATAAELEARTAEERALAAQLRHQEAEAGIGDAARALESLADRRTSLRESQRRALRVARAAEEGSQRGAVWVAEAGQRAAAARARAQEEERRTDALRARERELSVRMEALNRVRNEAEVRRAENRARSRAIAERAMDEWGISTADLLAIEAMSAPDEAEAQARIEQLDRDLRRLGAVNPRAAEEYAELAEREDFLTGQIDDLRSSRRDLLRVVGEIDQTIIETFGISFQAVAEEFERVFARLFPGGQGRLYLADPEDLLGSGIEVDARPAGKNVRKLSLLSGGERSLVALAFLFAIFRARPSPFYLLDEVEAALDDVNLARFIGLVEELEQRAQVMIVTHQKRTMEAADVLYGVSMSKDGITRVVAKRLEEVEGLSA